MSDANDRLVRFVWHPALPQVELRFSRYRQAAFHRHTHDTFSIGVLTQGRTRLCRYVPAERVEPIECGDIALINPGELHDCNPEPGAALGYYMLYVPPELLAGLAPGGAGALAFHMAVARDPALAAWLARLCRRMLGGDAGAAVVAELREALSAIVAAYAAAVPSAARADDRRLRAGHAYLLENLARNVPLDELARASGLSPYHFLRVFRGQFGLPPHTYQLQRRIQRARRLLAGGQPIAQVAAELGFADQSHFTRLFRVSVGATPREYQRGGSAEPSAAAPVAR